MPVFNDLPPEVTLQVFPHLPLKGLVAAEGVCRQWKEFIAAADIYPPRRGLFDLYQRIVRDPLFRDLDTRPWLWENLCPFNRQAYLDYILAQHNYIPEDFRLWILEWPNKAVIACAWPGLPQNYCSEEADDVERFVGYNHLGCLEPPLYKIGLDLKRICHPDAYSDEVPYVEYHPQVEAVGWDNDGGEDEDEDQADTGSETSESSLSADSSESDHPVDYYRIREVFKYSPPPGPDPMYKYFPALLVWEKYGGHQTFLALCPESPFAVYSIQHVGDYCSGQDRQYPTWISWLEAQLRRMHRAADWDDYHLSICGPRTDSDDNVMLFDTWFRSRANSTPLWTGEDEADHRKGSLAT